MNKQWGVAPARKVSVAGISKSRIDPGPKLSRRTLLTASALLPLGLAACAGQSTAQLQSDVQSIADALGGINSALAAIPQVPAATLAQVSQIIALIKADAGQIASTLTPNPNIVQSIANGVSALVPLVSPFFPAAPGVAAVVQAVLALVPVILNAVGKPVPVGAPPATMTPEQARMVLLAAPK